MLHAQFSRVCRCPNAKTCSSVFGRIKVDALGMVFVLSARVNAGNIVLSGSRSISVFCPCLSSARQVSEAGTAARTEVSVSPDYTRRKN